jgi:glycosyltransferase involved in cell wall biosynthesis
MTIAAADCSAPLPPPLERTIAMTTRCLWLARELPFPQDSGDRIHSARLALALAGAGADITFAGLHTADVAPDVPAVGDTPLVWHGITSGRRSMLRALASLQPLQSAIHATPAYARTVRALLRERWDTIVLDHYGSSWLLPHMRHARAGIGARPVLVHLSHNHEASLWRGMVQRYEGPTIKRLALWQNTLKIERAERRLAKGVDLLCCITPEDAGAFAADGIGTPSLVLTPGYSGHAVPARSITVDAPRRAILVGSFRWVVKQENLRALVQQADAVFARHGITLDIVGDMPAAMREALASCVAVRAHGFVDDLAPLLAQARVALVPEVIGGGFKLKLLDYVFHRVPVVTLNGATAGLPQALRQAMLVCADLPTLVDTVVRHIDDLPLLNRLQDQAFEAAHSAFDWADRGRMLLAAMRSARAGTKHLRSCAEQARV